MRPVHIFEQTDNGRVKLQEFKNARELSEHFDVPLRTANEWSRGRVPHNRDLRKYRFCPDHDCDSEKDAIVEYHKSLKTSQHVSS